MAKSQWEVFEKKGGKWISFYRDGRISVSSAAVKLIDTDTVTLWFNETEGLIGIKPAEAGEERGKVHKLRVQKRVDHPLISAKAFRNHYGLMKVHGRRSVTFEGGMLVARVRDVKGR